MYFSLSSTQKLHFRLLKTDLLEKCFQGAHIQKGQSLVCNECELVSLLFHIRVCNVISQTIAGINVANLVFYMLLSNYAD